MLSSTVSLEDIVGRLLLLLSQLGKEVDGTLCSHLRKVGLHHVVLNWLGQWTLLLWSAQLSTKVLLNLEGCLFLVDAKLSENVFVIVL